MYIIQIDKFIYFEYKELLTTAGFSESETHYVLVLAEQDKPRYDTVCKWLSENHILFSYSPPEIGMGFDTVEISIDGFEGTEDYREPDTIEILVDSPEEEVEDEDYHADDDEEGEEEVAQYKVESHRNKDANLHRFFGRKSSQRSASTYHSIYDKDCVGDEVFYIRNQKDHYLSNIKNSEDDPSSKHAQIKQNYFILASNPYNFGLDPSFGFEFNHKGLESNGIYRPQIPRGATRNLQATVDGILVHKNTAVRAIVDEVNEFELETVIVDEAQLAAQYPCVVVRLNDAYWPHFVMKQKATTNEYDAAYSAFLTHLLIACINKELYEDKVGFFFDRRQSFGFLTPTASDVGSAIRLSLGLIPNMVWLRCVVRGITNFDELVNTQWENGAIQASERGMGTPHRKFRSGNIDIYAHKLFLMVLLEDYFPRDIIGYISELDGNYDTIKGEVAQEDYFADLTEQLTTLETVPVDTDFQAIFTKIYTLYAILNEDVIEDIDFAKGAAQLIDELDTSIDTYRQKAVREVSTLEDIDITSESDDEHAVPKLHGAKDKYYSPAGMSALTNPLFAYANLKKAKVNYFVAPYAYFELNSMKLSKLKIKATDNYEDAEIVFLDVNPCVNADTPPPLVEQIIAEYSEFIQPSFLPKIVVVDITSSTQEQIDSIKKTWTQSNIPLLCLARSGIKHMQFSLDLAQYGENSLLINDNYLKKMKVENPELAQSLEANCKSVASELASICKATSSVFATHVRRAMRMKLHEFNKPGMEETDHRYHSEEVDEDDDLSELFSTTMGLK